MQHTESPSKPMMMRPMQAYPSGATAGPVDLTCLAPLDSLFVKQEIEMLEALTGIETQNKYKIYAKTQSNAPLFLAKEESDFCARNCLGNMRPFRLNISSPVTGQTIVSCIRPYKCCLSEVTVEDGRGSFLGTVKQRCVCCARIFSVYDAHDNELFEIYGPCCSPWTFFIRQPRNADGSEGQGVGEIKKKWSGILKEMLTDADNFGCDFDVRLPNEHKALLLAAVFLIDYVYFEDNNNKGGAGAF